MDKTFFEKNTLLYSILLQSAEMNVHMAQETILRTSESNTELQNTYIQRDKLQFMVLESWTTLNYKRE